MQAVAANLRMQAVAAGLNAPDIYRSATLRLIVK
jgi:hypothetical protein